MWFTTRSALFRPGDEAWEEVARYEQPLRRLLARRYGHLPQHERDDLVQSVLIEIKEQLSGTFDRSRGKFRALLQTVVSRRVVDLMRQTRPASLPEELRAPSPAELDALDLEAALVAAVSACRDHFSGGRHKDLAVLHALSDRLVHGLTSVQIAHKEGVSRDRISRLLAKGRDVIFQHLLASELPATGPAGLEQAMSAFKRMLRKPGAAQAELERLSDRGQAEQLGEFWERFRAALPRFEGDLSAAGRELATGVELILGEPAEG